MLGGGFFFAGASQVPWILANLGPAKRAILWVGAAGPGGNLFMALFWVLMVKLGLQGSVGSLSTPLALMGAAGVLVNAMFMVLNLLPLPPLDGGRIMVSLLPHRQAYQFSRIEPYGFFILIGLMFAGVLNYILWPGVVLTVQLVAAVFDVSVSDLYRLTMILSRS